MNAFTAALKLIDPFVIALTGLFSYYLRFDDLELPANYRTVILVLQGMAWALLMFFTIALVAFAILRRGETRPPATP